MRGRLELLDQLAAVHAGHAVVADQQVGGIVYGLEQGVGGVAGGRDLAERGERACNIPSTMGLSSTSRTLTLFDM